MICNLYAMSMSSPNNVTTSKSTPTQLSGVILQFLADEMKSRHNIKIKYASIRMSRRSVLLFRCYYNMPLNQMHIRDLHCRKTLMRKNELPVFSFQVNPIHRLSKLLFYIKNVIKLDCAFFSTLSTVRNI